MFESIQGHLVFRDPARCVVETGGIGYEILISVRTFEQLPLRGETARLMLHPVVREDGWRLFGFAEEDERSVFRDLLRVNGVGPMMALSLLSCFRPDELANAVTTADVRALTRVKGVGRKTAERILVELRDRWKDGAVRVTTASGLPAPTEHDAIRALEALGLDGAEARRRVQRVLEADPAAELAGVVRLALRG